MRKTYKIIFILFLINIQLSISETPAEIYYKLNPVADTVDFGMCLVNDSLKCDFILHNIAKLNLKIRDSYPSFAISQSPGHTDEFAEFNYSTDFNFPRTIFKGDKADLPILYSAKSNLTQFPPGKKEARLRIGLFDPDEITVPAKDSDLVVYRDFVLISRKTKYYIDGFDKDINFDSVYVNPIFTPRKKWLVQNSSIYPISIDFERQINISSNPEFVVHLHPEDLDFPPNKTRKEWLISYYPTNLGADTARFELHYHPQRMIFPDSVDVAYANIYGFGVLQRLDVSNITGGFITNDTIYLGNVPVNGKKTLTVTLKNTGNMNFGALSEELLKLKDNSEPKCFTIKKKLTTENQNLFPNEYGSFIIEFSPDALGEFKARYVITSDISKRKIAGAPIETNTITFFIIGNGIEPRINTANNDIDLGNVVIHEKCPTIRDTTIFIANNGNTDLLINKIYLDPEPPSPFSFSFAENRIIPNSQKPLKITFNSESQPVGIDFESNLIFVSNCTPPLDTFKLKLKAKGIEPYPMKVSTNSVNERPGNIVTIPILVEKNKIWRAKIFESTLIYNKSLLKYSNYNVIGTASAGARVIDIQEDSLGGLLEISLSMPANMNFDERDTLILLIFKSYLGNTMSTPITFKNPKFSDGICEMVLTPEVIEGSFTLDSVCGLQYKVIHNGKWSFNLGNCYPNPADNYFEFDYELPFETYTTIKLYNIYGEIQDQILSELSKSGVHTMKYNSLHLAPGAYYYVMQSGIYKEVRKVIIKD